MVPQSSELATPQAAVAATTNARRHRMSTARALLPGHRVATCGWRPSADTAGVVLCRDLASGSIRVDGGHACGSVWVCPHCAARITEARAADLVEAVRVWRPHGGVAMLTLTVPHSWGESLLELHARLRVAMAALRGHRTWKALASEHFAGSVRAFETLHGVNGWHPHFHILLFTSTNLDPQALAGIRARISAIWQGSAVAAGFTEPDWIAGANLVSGVTVDERLAAYVSKFTVAPTVEQLADLRSRSWGAEREIAKWHIKKSRTGLAPFQILDLLSGRLPPAQRSDLFALWLEYATATKGQRQLVWQRGWKRQLEELGAIFDDRTDAEIVEAPALTEARIASIPATSWRWIVGLRLAESLLRLVEWTPHLVDIHIACALKTVDEFRQARHRLIWSNDPDRPDPNTTFLCALSA